jgi:hypothetical protein
MEEKKAEIRVGDIIRLKKAHPCGSREWQVLRIGQDFRLKCAGCGHQIMLKRREVEKNIRTSGILLANRENKEYNKTP